MLQEKIPHGIGRCTSIDGNCFHEGQFKNGKMHGYGRAIFDWGGYYEGLWKNNVRYGLGRFVNEKGDVFEGMWNDGKPHGQLAIKKKGELVTIQGIWEHGRLKGKGKEWYQF